MFPERLVEDHILTWTVEGDTVLDPFAGSGTTTKMAHINGRNWIGIDISEEYVAIANKRMEVAEKMRKAGYKREVVSSARDTIASDGKLSHKEISELKKKDIVNTMLKWQDELTELRKEQKGINNESQTTTHKRCTN
jgi:adenine specific DNA methylase Mod